MIESKKKLKIPLITVIVGTRPELIKLAPVVKAIESCKHLNCRLILTGQHKEMLSNLLEVFEMKENKNLNIHIKGQTLHHITSKIINGLKKEFFENKPNLILVQGDTTTAFAGALTAFYDQIPIGHVEAGLRTNNLKDPFPEEANRRMISQISSLHFAPTLKAKNNLITNGISNQIYITGNTVIDSLLMLSPKVKTPYLDKINWKKQKVILVTAHRRENWGENIINISKAIRTLLERNSDLSFIIPMHKNKVVRKPFQDLLSNNRRVLLVEPLSYDQLVSVMKNAYLILTDSGGIQEEAPSLGKPVLILRKTTEREEAIDSGTAKLTGTNENNIVEEVMNLVSNEKIYQKMARKINPFGDGNASKRIINICTNFLTNNRRL